MIDVTNRLYQTLLAVCPITSISVGTIGDSSTVTILYDPSANDAQKTLAATTLSSFDWSAAATQTYDNALHPNRTALANLAAQAVADINTYLAIPTPTQAQAVAAIGRLATMMRAVIQRLVESP